MRRLFRFILRLAIILLLLSVGSVVLYRYVPVPVTPLMLKNAVGAAIKGEATTFHHDWVPMGEMSPHLVNAVIASEDQRFYSHHGFDWKEIGNAIEERKAGKRKRGGSTISQQTAKNVFLWPSSDWVRKGLEAYFTVLIELVWSKERIMEVYLNSIEMGPGIYGAQAVAQAHFGTDAKSLNRTQCALIAASLPNPLRYNSAAPSSYMNKRKQQIIRLMNLVKPFSLTDKD